MSLFKNIAVIGGGSWATAIVKMLSENQESVSWWMRNEDNINHIKRYGNNPNYISAAELFPNKLTIDSDINAIVDAADCIVLAVPSAFLTTTLESLNVSIKDKFVVSAIKGIVPENNTIIGDYLHENYHIPYENIGVITGPCHAEEVALERLSYLTVACEDVEKAEWFAEQINCRYIKTNVSEDIYGTEIAAVLKNVIAIASGVCHSLGYGDNFQAVLASNAIREIKRFVDTVHPIKKRYQRVRLFGRLIGYRIFSIQ